MHSIFVLLANFHCCKMAVQVNCSFMMTQNQKKFLSYFCTTPRYSMDVSSLCNKINCFYTLLPNTVCKWIFLCHQISFLEGRKSSSRNVCNPSKIVSNFPARSGLFYEKFFQAYPVLNALINTTQMIPREKEKKQINHSLKW